jgi:hypothetical protein
MMMSPPTGCGSGGSASCHFLIFLFVPPNSSLLL